MPVKISLVVGARPNFIKAAPLMEELKKYPDNVIPTLIHSGQHYDNNLSQLFFDELKMPEPDIFLGVGSASHAVQTSRIMIELEKLWLENPPDLVIVFGDVNSTMAAALVAAKLCIKLAHVEAGLRSFDNSMPEEINRIVTDRLSDYHFISEVSGLVNLKNEGISGDGMDLVGNIMIDSLVKHLEAAKISDILGRLSLEPGKYAAMTLHRPANVDNKEILESLITVFNKIGQEMPIIFPCHPRTQKNIDNFGLRDKFDENSLRVIDPLGYLDFLKLQSEAGFVLTDSGGIQEETTYLNIPCITIRDNTERPVTVDVGSNIVTGVNPSRILEEAGKILSGKPKLGSIPELWDGRTAKRITEYLIKEFSD
jgi:UDP-N-acetylglucosamine 2-epimerase (non-hydrolysing)